MSTDEDKGLYSRIRFVVETNPDASATSYYRPRFSVAMSGTTTPAIAIAASSK